MAIQLMLPNRHGKQALTWLCLLALLLSSCKLVTISPTPIPMVHAATGTPVPTMTQILFSTATWTPLPTLTTTHTVTPTLDMWVIQKCRKLPNELSVIKEDNFIWEYIGDITGGGEIAMLLNFTKENEIQGFYFEYEQVREYRVNGCVEGRIFMMWLQQNDVVVARIKGELPETDPRGHYDSSGQLEGDVLVGSLMQKEKPEKLPIYLRLNSGGGGTMKHRFWIAAVEDDSVILNASRQFLSAIASDDRAGVVQMIQFPFTFQKDGKTTLIQKQDSFLAQYDEIFDASFKARLAKTFPNYLMAYTGNFYGIGQPLYGGGGINFDEHGKITAIYNWQKPAPMQPAIGAAPPTLELEKAREAIKTLLREPVDCSAPCFWGIIPWRTTNEEAKDIFSHLGIQMASRVDEGNGFSGIDYALESGLSIGATLKIHNNIVENIQIQISPEKQKVGIPREWLAYSPETLIKRYGLPSRVDFAFDPGPRLFLAMQMYFDAEDFIAQYTGVDIISTQKGASQFCPLIAQFDTAWLWMGQNPINPPGQGIPLEKVTSLTLEEFSKLMTGDPKHACFIFDVNAFR